MIKTYFAMPITYYNDPGLLNDINFLKSIGYDPYIPNSATDEAGYESHGIEYFRNLISTGDFRLLVFRSFAGIRYAGNISAGVAEEIRHAFSCNIPISELTQNKDGVRKLTISNANETSMRSYDITQTRKMIEHIRSNHLYLNGLGGIEAIL